MKTKKMIMMFYTICLLTLIIVLPVSAKSRPMPRKITLNRKEIFLYAGETKKLTVQKVKPADASSKVSWISKNNKIAVVSGSGKVTAKKAGKTTITAISKKNPSAKAVVSVIIKNTPAKKEKDCDFSWTLYGNKSVSLLKPRMSDRTEPVIIRSEEDLREIVKSANIRNVRKKVSLRNTFLSQYLHTDFEKESLVIFFFSDSHDSISHKVTSCTTALDPSGKLQGKVVCKYKTVPDSMSVLTVMDNYAIVLKLRRKDEAMIDSFHLEFQREE